MIKRNIYLIIQTAVAVLLFSACQESGIIDNAVLTQNYVEPEYSVGVSKTTFEVASDGGELSLEVYVSNNLPWQATTAESWATLSQTSGKGNATITLTVLANETGEVRQATVTIKAREKSASVTITQEGAKETPDEEIDGHVYVNLGLPSGLLWATCNVGADKPEDYGDYFAWGETTTKNTYNWRTYKWCNGSETTLTKYNTKSSYGTVDNKTVLDLSDDAARANWGGGWRMATKDEWQELKDNCTWTWTNQGGHNGYKVTSKSNGNSIFLPAAGSHRDSDLYYAGVDGDYWSSSLGADLLDIAWGVGFNSGDVGAWSGSGRDCGRSVRPVWKEEAESYFEVSPSDLSFGSAGGTSSLTITSNRVWNVSTEASWLTLSVSYGSGDGTLSVTAFENTSTDIRTGVITFTADGKNYTVSVTQEGAESQYEEIDGHAYVNLGLPSGLLWATCNVGADNPEDYGGYFAWGETTTKTTYSWNTYKWCNGSETTLTKYNTDRSYGTVDNKTVLDLSDDAARANWGGSWRMATLTEWLELEDNCTWTWTTQGGNNGYKVTSKSNGNSIFLPAAGLHNGTVLGHAGEYGYCWSSTLNWDGQYRAWGVYFGSGDAGDVGAGNFPRCYGFSVRPVWKEEAEPYFEVSPSDLSFDSAGGTSSLTITSNRVWNVSTDASWLTLSASYGSGDGTLSVTAFENISTDSRTGAITFTADGKDYMVSVTQEGAEPQYEEIDGHAYVNLGLPSGLLWATCNVGADNPEDYGGYFAWGETTTKSTYSWSTYQWCNGSETTLTKYNTDRSYGTVDNKTVLDLADDAARANWGGNWRMATQAEWLELKDNCTWTWTTQGGHNGYKVTSKSNGNSIFLPAAGLRDGASLAGWGGRYWSPSLDADNPNYAWIVVFDSSSSGVYFNICAPRCRGLSVRPVWKEEAEPYFEVSPSDLSFDSAGGTSSLTITSNRVWNVSTDASWLTLSASYGSGDGTLSVTAFENTSTDIRTGVITFTADGKDYEVSVTQEKYEEIDGHAYVNLDLPSGLLWATCNVGADKPEDYGDNFAWGETTTKTTYRWSTYMWCNGNNTTLTKYNTYSSYGTVDNKTELDLSDDAVRANWGGSWRMATKDEWQELKDNCTWTWTIQGGSTGRKVTSKSNGNSIFLPAAGYRWDSVFNGAGEVGYYWSSSLDADYPTSAWYMSFNSGYVYDWYNGSRDGGRSVRPVCRP